MDDVNSWERSSFPSGHEQVEANLVILNDLPRLTCLVRTSISSDGSAMATEEIYWAVHGVAVPDPMAFELWYPHTGMAAGDKNGDAFTG